MKQNRFVPLISGSLGLGAVLFILATRPVATPSPDGTPANFKIAFIGDQQLGADPVAVLNLIKSEGASAVVHSGDFDYNDNPSARLTAAPAPIGGAAAARQPGCAWIWDRRRPLAEL